MKIKSNKQLLVDDHLREICRQIVIEDKNESEWSEVESDDMFQLGPFVGGFDAIEQEFWFSYYDQDNNEWWFGFSLSDALRIKSGALKYLDMREPD